MKKVYNLSPNTSLALKKDFFLKNKLIIGMKYSTDYVEIVFV